MPGTPVTLKKIKNKKASCSCAVTICVCVWPWHSGKTGLQPKAGLPRPRGSVTLSESLRRLGQLPLQGVGRKDVALPTSPRLAAAVGSGVEAPCGPAALPPGPRAATPGLGGQQGAATPCGAKVIPARFAFYSSSVPSAGPAQPPPQPSGAPRPGSFPARATSGLRSEVHFSLERR